jgi:hypothetical protein
MSQSLGRRIAVLEAKEPSHRLLSVAIRIRA